jgi:hypothetical protein
MALVLATVDTWTDLGRNYEIFVRADQLTDPGYRVRLEVGGGNLEVRCLAPLPAGFWIRPTRGGPLYVPSPYDTAQFRLDEDRP